MLSPLVQPSDPGFWQLQPPVQALAKSCQRAPTQCQVQLPHAPVVVDVVVPPAWHGVTMVW